jgi:hypothetical protein
MRTIQKKSFQSQLEIYIQDIIHYAIAVAVDCSSTVTI